jgi:hypothetical protein
MALAVRQSTCIAYAERLCAYGGRPIIERTVLNSSSGGDRGSLACFMRLSWPAASGERVPKGCCHSVGAKGKQNRDAQRAPKEQRGITIGIGSRLVRVDLSIAHPISLSGPLIVVADHGRLSMVTPITINHVVEPAPLHESMGLRFGV